MFSASVDESGPIFNGQARAAVRAFVVDAENEVAEQGVVLVRQELDRVLRHPTGYYRSNVRADDGRVHDNRVIYGPWLEGVGSQNRTTRFKGYATFRRMKQVLQAQAGSVAERVLGKYIGRMG